MIIILSQIGAMWQGITLKYLKNKQGGIFMFEIPKFLMTFVMSVRLVKSSLVRDNSVWFIFSVCLAGAKYWEGIEGFGKAYETSVRRILKLEMILFFRTLYKVSFRL